MNWNLYNSTKQFQLEVFWKNDEYQKQEESTEKDEPSEYNVMDERMRFQFITNLKRKADLDFESTFVD